MRKRITVIIAWLTSVLVAGAFVGLLYADRFPRDFTLIAVPAALIAMPPLVGLATYLMRGVHNRVAALLAAATPVILVGSGLCAFMVVDGAWVRYGVGVVSMAATALFLAYWRGLSRGDSRFHEADFAHLTLALHVFAMFFVFTASFGVTNYLQIPVPVMAGVVGLLTLVTVAETLRRSAVAAAYVVPLSLTLTAIMAESYVAISQLPTTNLVNALAGVMVYATSLYAGVAVLTAGPRPNRFGRQLVLAVALVALVFSTANWA